MNDTATVRRVEDAVADLLRQRGDVAAAYLLGSAVRGRLRPDSDIDIALLPVRGQTIPLRARLAVAAELEDRLGRTVDVGLVTPGNLVYASEAILNGQRIMTADDDYVAAMETRLLGCYLQLRQDRREVEDAYRAA